MKKKSTYEGRQGHIKKFKLPLIETWDNIYKDKKYVITMEIPEFTCICPKTGLPDFATITISYIPDKSCIELKSLKEYIVAYRQLGIFHENVVNRVLADFVKACKPKWALVDGNFNPRGGIKTTVKAEFGRK